MSPAKSRFNARRLRWRLSCPAAVHAAEVDGKSAGIVTSRQSCLSRPSRGGCHSGVRYALVAVAAEKKNGTALRGARKSSINTHQAPFLAATS